jgi:hypothetical protein
MYRAKSYTLLLLGASQGRWSAICAHLVLPGDLCAVNGLVRTRLEAPGRFHPALAPVLSGHAPGVVSPLGIGQELFPLHQARRALICPPLVGYQREVRFPAPYHVRRNHPGSFWQPAALRHLDNPVPGMLCPSDSRARPARGGCTGERVW